MKFFARSLIAMTVLPAVFAGAAEPNLYRIELAGNGVLLAKTPPVPRGSLLVYSRYPDGALMSLKRADVRRVVVTPIGKTEAKTVKPGTLIVLGPTGEGAGSAASGTAPTAAGRPGEGPGGKALFNPARDYRPDWDAKQVPGQSLAYPASAGDYREGATMAYPPGSATQSGSGQPPTGVPSGQPPKSQ